MGPQEPAPPRRKSCEACKVAKRRCDLEFPACSRCISRGSPCIYPGRLPAAYQDLVHQTTQVMEPIGFNATQFSTNIDSPVDQTFVYTPESMESQQIWSHDTSTRSIQGPFFDANFALIFPRTRSLRPLSEVIASYLQFAVDVLKNTPWMMVTENQTPWCHRNLYKNHMPKDMQGVTCSNSPGLLPLRLTQTRLDAYACCSLYMCKNDINAPVIMNLLEERLRELLSSPEPTELLEVLARTHALLLHQIMRLVDGDIRARTAADTLFATLESSVLKLMETVPTPTPSDETKLLPPSMEETVDFWERWVLQESARRTVLFTYYFISIYKVLQETSIGHCDGKLGLEHAWYFSGHLWNAPSAFDFAVAWSEKQHHIVYNLNFEPILRNAQPNEVDLFGKMLLVTALGIDKARAWFHIRGAIL